MPYISAEKVQEIRKKLKEEFPSWKFSVRRENHMVHIAITKAPYNLLPKDKPDYVVFNHFSLENFLTGTALKDVQKIRSIALDGCGGRHDSDYGFVPDWYLELQVGAWDNPFKIVENKVKKIKKSIPETFETSPVKTLSLTVSHDSKTTIIPEKVKPKKAPAELTKNLDQNFDPEDKTIRIIEYTEKTMVVLGDSREIQQELSWAGGHWNPFLRNPKNGENMKGWLFRKQNLERVKKIILALVHH